MGPDGWSCWRRWVAVVRMCVGTTFRPTCTSVWLVILCANGARPDWHRVMYACQLLARWWSVGTTVWGRGSAATHWGPETDMHELHAKGRTGQPSPSDQAKMHEISWDPIGGNSHSHVAIWSAEISRCQNTITGLPVIGAARQSLRSTHKVWLPISVL